MKSLYIACFTIIVAIVFIGYVEGNSEDGLMVQRQSDSRYSHKIDYRSSARRKTYNKSNDLKANTKNDSYSKWFLSSFAKELHKQGYNAGEDEATNDLDTSTENIQSASDLYYPIKEDTTESEYPERSVDSKDSKQDIEERWSFETSDPSWTEETEEYVSEMIIDSEIDARLEGVDCRTTLCRTEVVFDNMSDATKMTEYAGDPSGVKIYPILEGKTMRVVAYIPRSDHESERNVQGE